MLKFKPFHFPVHWKFKDPDTGALFTAQTREALIKHIVTYRSQNRLEAIESLDQVVDNYLCGLPANAGGCMPMQLKRGVLQYIKGGIALIKNTLKEHFVEQPQADERAEICIKCPNNVFLDRNQFIAWSDAIAKKSVGDRQSKHHNELGNCQVCSCPLRAKVWTTPPFGLAPEHEAQMRKDNPACWQLKENIK